jgi:predicted transcriptional regulator
MLTMAEATKLRRMRMSLGVTQEALVKRMRTLRVRSYIRAERGDRKVTHDTAVQILDAINEVRNEQGLPPVTIDDLGLSIY